MLVYDAMIFLAVLANSLHIVIMEKIAAQAFPASQGSFLWCFVQNVIHEKDVSAAYGSSKSIIPALVLWFKKFHINQAIKRVLITMLFVVFF